MSRQAAAGLGIVWSTTVAECKTRFRERLSMLRLFMLSVLCAALVPPSHAGYAILHVDRSAPQMSANTALLAAAVVLSAIALLVYGLMLDTGRSRDQQQRLQALFGSQPASIRLILLGRLCANITYAHAMVLFAGLALSTTLFARHGQLPSAEAFLLFACIVSPAVVSAAIVAMLIDTWLSRWVWLRVVSVLSVFSAGLVLSMFSPVDIVGISALRQLIGDATSGQMIALGFIKSDAAAQFAWHTLAVPASQIIVPRLQLLGALLCAGSILAWLAAPGLQKPAPTRVTASPQQRVSPSAVRPVDLYRHPAPAPASQPFTAALGGVGIVLQRLLARSKLACALLIFACGNGAAAGNTGLSLTLVLLAVVVVIAATPAKEFQVAASIERCEPALAPLGPQLTVFFALFLPAVAAAMPALLRLDLQQAATALCGLSALQAWLIWTHRQLDLPVAGIAVAGTLLYAVVFNNPPPGADIFGLWHSHPQALLISAICAVLAMLPLLPRGKA